MNIEPTFRKACETPIITILTGYFHAGPEFDWSFLFISFLNIQ